RQSVTVHQQNKTDIHIHGDNAEAIAKETKRHLERNQNNLTTALQTSNSQVAGAVQEGSGDVYNSITSVQNYVNGVSSKYVINPHGMQGIAGFVFDYE